MLRVDAVARDTAADAAVASSSKSRAVTARRSAKNSCGPRVSAASTGSRSRPPDAGCSLSTRTPGTGSRNTVTVCAATLPAAPPPTRYHTRTSRPSAGTAATAVPAASGAGANVTVPVPRSSW
ncbi:hypothetical protein GCM10027610_083470 [Dactylosporangium cerinum]